MTTSSLVAVAALALALAAATAAAAATPTVALAWRGIDRDLVGASEFVTPDGVADGHFTLTLDARSAPLRIRQLEVRLTDRRGVVEGSQIWDTVVRNGYWALGVVSASGRVLNAGEKRLALLTVPGKATFQLYTANSGYFTPGQYFKVKVTLTDGRVLKALTRIR